MKRQNLKLEWKALASATIIACTLPMTGCLDWIGMDQGSVVIDGIQKTDTCVPVVANGAQIGSGILDVASGFGYTASLSMRTNIPATVNTQQLQQERQRSVNYPNYGNTDTAVVTFNTMRVWFSDADNGDYVNNLPTDVPFLPWERLVTNNGLEIAPPTRERRTAVGGTVANTQTSLGAGGIVFAPAISEREALALQTNFDSGEFPNATKTIIANITVEGKTSGGANVESTTFGFPITVCQGCLIGEPTNCPVGTSPTPNTDKCTPFGQDEPEFICQ